jgi:hypothetical protein
MIRRIVRKKNILKPCPFKCVRDLEGVREENT